MDLKKLQDAEAIIREVRQLRIMQKEYFRHRDIEMLNKCKIQEKKIDEMIAQYYSRPTLF